MFNESKTYWWLQKRLMSSCAHLWVARNICSSREREQGVWDQTHLDSSYSSTSKTLEDLSGYII